MDSSVAETSIYVIAYESVTPDASVDTFQEDVNTLLEAERDKPPARNTPITVLLRDLQERSMLLKLKMPLRLVKVNYL